ncbi:hypothetical protein CLF_107882 [Clonorchis sinensis]|uniref:Reverse transcriptase domain-containing protein n=1 Tax=Clonorchis sinensis TaxID=79923 RepID=G7YR39_CLOSI|nr:hypothetical protein CLF_107882 [Clonorchis sinensis]
MGPKTIQTTTTSPSANYAILRKSSLCRTKWQTNGAKRFHIFHNILHLPLDTEMELRNQTIDYSHAWSVVHTVTPVLFEHEPGHDMHNSRRLGCPRIRDHTEQTSVKTRPKEWKSITCSTKPVKWLRTTPSRYSAEIIWVLLKLKPCTIGTLVPAATVSITGKRECGTYNETLEAKHLVKHHLRQFRYPSANHPMQWAVLLVCQPNRCLTLAPKVYTGVNKRTSIYAQKRRIRLNAPLAASGTWLKPVSLDFFARWELSSTLVCQHHISVYNSRILTPGMDPTAFGLFALLWDRMFRQYSSRFSSMANNQLSRFGRNTKTDSKNGLGNLAIAQPSCNLRVAWQSGTKRVLQLNGLLQKVVSPFLFDFIIDELMRRTLKGLQIVQIIVGENLEFADDIALIFEDEGTKQALLNKLITIIPSFGMRFQNA